MSFTINTISDEFLQNMVANNVWREECPVHYSRLKLIGLNYVGFDGTTNYGELVILDNLAEPVISIFKELFALTFQIEKILPIEVFNGDDVLSMKANNSSAYNGRLVARTNSWSSHAYGAAIDINPIQNPYLLLNEQLELKEVIPPAGADYLDRANLRQGMVEEIVPIFEKYGFTEWGGKWKEKPDYHHFQLPWDNIRELFPE